MSSESFTHARYVAEAELGRGGQAVVLRVRDRERPDVLLAAKVYRPGTFDPSALAGEFALLSRARLPGLVRAHDFGRDDRGAPFLIEELVEGPDAIEHVHGAPEKARNARLFSMLADVVSTLAGLHGAGFVHGDLKPAHVRIRDGHAVLLDLGAAVTSVWGLSPGFAAPEIVAGAKPDWRADLWSLGAVAWASITGAPPEKNASLRDRAPWLRPSVADVIASLLAEHPADRPKGADDVLGLLGRAADADLRSAAAAPPPIGRDAELAQLCSPAGPRVRFITGPSGIGKSHLAREVVTRALLAGREVRVVAWPGEDAAIALRLVTYLRGRAEAWPFTSSPGSTLLVVDGLDAAPGELAQAIDAHRCRPVEGGPMLLVTAREAPHGAHSIALAPLDAKAMTELARRLGTTDIASAAGNPGWLVAAAGRIPLAQSTALERLKNLSNGSKEAIAFVATAGGALDESILRTLSTDPAAASSAGLLTRSRRGERTLWALPALGMAADLAAALAEFERTDRLAAALLRSDASASALLSVAHAPSPPSRRDDLLTAAVERARRDGERSIEIDALLSLLASPKERTGERLARLERLVRDSGASSPHPAVLAWLDEAAAADPSLRCLALRRKAEKAAREGDTVSAAKLAIEARQAAHAMRDPVGEALALATEGAVALYRADVGAADVSLRDARARLAALETSDAEELARLEHNAGVVALYRGSTDEAILAFRQSLERKRALGDRSGMAACLFNLGHALGLAKRWEEAIAALDEAHALARSLGQIGQQAWALGGLADVEVRRGDGARAERFVAEALALGDDVPRVLRDDLAIVRGKIALLAGDGHRALAALDVLDAEQRAADALLDARATAIEARASLSVLPVDARKAARLAIRAIRRAREAEQRETADEAADTLRDARSATRARSALASYAPLVGTDDGIWSWLERLASGDEAAAHLARLVRASLGAERAFVVALTSPGSDGDDVESAAGVDLDDLEIAEAERRIDRELVRRAARAGHPVYERDVVTPGGRGSRIAVVHGRGAIVAEHRFQSGRFDGIDETAMRRFALLAALVNERPVAQATEREAIPPARISQPTTTLPLHEPSRSFPAILGSSVALRRALARLDAAIDSDLPVLVVGETGSGKELFARAIHELGPRSKGPFVAVNCGAIPDNLFEAELFGHAKGSFTGADRARPGLLARAEGGVLLLDEIGELPPLRQAALLRALETRRYRAVGADDEKPFDVRIVAATNRDLEREVEAGTFRRDLLYRLDVLTIRVPALRERPEDIPLLARAFLDHEKSTAQISAPAMAQLTGYGWPGNVRELEHAMQRLAAMRVRTIEPSHLPRAVRAARGGTIHGKDDERAQVERALASTGGNISRAAQQLGLTRHGLKKRMIRLGLRPAAGGSG
jgi:DNA-binding NtrC family response regulator/tetratricopeptide (TPR) repeat protein